jgi:phosphoribosylglycinamide formyltransferase-1
MPPLRIAVVLSAGGSAFYAAAKIAGADIDPVVITDRPCMAEQACAQAGFEHLRIDFSTRSQFSADVLATCRARDVRRVLLLYSRLVGPELFDQIECLNIHPSLLPSFPGLRPIEQLLASGMRFIGATLHEVDASVDGGKIRAQTVAPLPPSPARAWADRASFLQKTLLCLSAFEGPDPNGIACPQLSPRLQSRSYWTQFLKLQASLPFALYHDYCGDFPADVFPVAGFHGADGAC